MHRPVYHGDYERHGNGIAEICNKCSHDNVLVPVSFCPEAMKYIKVEEVLDRMVGEWHDGSGDQEIYEYFGWTEKEYAHWINAFEMPQWFINKINGEQQ